MHWGAFFEAAQLAGKLWEAYDKSSPQLVQKVEVAVYGNPQSNKNELYKLAIATAFGLVRRKDIRILGFTLPAGALSLTYNAELKQVKFSIIQMASWSSTWGAGDPVQILDGILTERDKTHDTNLGGSWEWDVNAPALVKFPGSVFGADIVTGYENRVILTDRAAFFEIVGPRRLTPAKSPAPKGDYISRGSPTIASNPALLVADPTNWYTTPEYMLFTALSLPCNATSQAAALPPIPPGVPVPATVVGSPITVAG